MLIRHARTSGNPVLQQGRWIPAFAAITEEAKYWRYGRAQPVLRITLAPVRPQPAIEIVGLLGDAPPTVVPFDPLPARLPHSRPQLRIRR